MQRLPLRAAVLLSAVAVMTTPLRAADERDNSRSEAEAAGRGVIGVIDARADQWLRRMSDYLGSMRQFSFVAEAAFDEVSETTGQKLQFSRLSRVDVARPDAIRGATEGDLESRRYWYDGRRLTILDTDRNVYSQVSVPPRIDDMFDHVADEYGLVVPLSDLLFDDVYDALVEGVLIGQYVGRHRVGPYRCHHLAFTQDTIDWQIWIEDGERPLPRKMVITYKDLPDAPQYTALFTEWRTRESFPSDHFRFEPPATARRVEMSPAEEQSEVRSAQLED